MIVMTPTDKLQAIFAQESEMIQELRMYSGRGVPEHFHW